MLSIFCSNITFRQKLSNIEKNHSDVWEFLMRQQQTANSVVDTDGYCPQLVVSIISAVKDNGRFTAGKAREYFEEVSVAPILP